MAEVVGLKRYVEFPPESGAPILVEVEEPDTVGGTVRAGREPDVPETARLTFEEALDKVRPTAQTIIARLRNLSDPPDQVGAEFGLKLSGTAGAMIASAGVEANDKVTLTWKRSE